MARLYLPRALEVGCQQETVSAEVPPRGQGERILVVEDKEDVRELVVTLLTKLGYEVRAASRGGEALRQLVEADPFDLLLSDVVLPGSLSGPCLAQQARDISPKLGVLLMSGYYGSAFGPETPGVEDWPLIRKPFGQEELASALRQVLEARASRETGLTAAS